MGLESLVKVRCRDVCEIGFKVPDDEKNVLNRSNSIDAIFLDLPEPWRAIDSAYDLLKPGRTICTYSPCIEQVVKTCEKLREKKMHSIKMVEVRLRPSHSKVMSMSIPDMGTNLTDGFIQPNPVTQWTDTPKMLDDNKTLVNIPAYWMKGHTAFLTFASK